jgi:GGDEF domain-containing protein
VEPDFRTEPLLADPVTGFGSRRALLAHLERAVDPASRPSVVAVFGLDGIEEVVKLHGMARGDEVIARLAEDLARTVGPAGTCFVPRRREFCVHCELPLDEATPILAVAAISLRREGAINAIRTPFGIVVLPEGADDPIAALAVADRNLNESRRARRALRSARS